MRTSGAIARSLLDLEKQRTAALFPNARIHGIAIAVLNLIPAGLSEGYVRTDSSGYGLGLFLFCHSAFFFFLSIAQHIGSIEVIRKTQIFPTTSFGRYVFALRSNLRQPLLLGLIASNCFFLLIAFRSSLSVSIVAVVCYVLLMISIAAVASLIFLSLEKKKLPAHLALVAGILLTFLVLSLSMVFPTAASSAAFSPIIDIAVRATWAASQGNFLPALLAASLFVSIIGITFAVAGRSA